MTMPSLRWTRLVRVATVALLSTSGAVALAPTAANAAGGAVVDDAGCRANTLARNDDLSTGAVALPGTFRFYGKQVSQVFVNNNGNLSFEGAMSDYSTRLDQVRAPAIAPFFADVQTSYAPSSPVTYGTTTYGGRPAFCATWPGVAGYGLDGNRLNTFQAYLVDRSDVATGDFDVIFNYDQLVWDLGTASNNSAAQVGFSAADGNAEHVYVFPGSQTTGTFVDSNTATGLVRRSRESDVLGRYVFRFRDGVPTGITPPDTSIVTKPAARSKTRDVAFTYATSSEPGEHRRYDCRLTIAGATAPAFATCPDAGTSYTGLPDGTYTFEVRAVDAFYSADGTPASYTFSVDNTGPAMTVDEGPAPLSNETSPVFAFSSDDEDLVSTECNLNRAGSLEPSPWFDCEDTYAPGPLGEGDWVFQVRATDDLGNVGEPTSYDFVIDTTATGVTITDAPPFLTNDTAPVFGYEFDPADDVDLVECRVYADGDAESADFEECGADEQQVGYLDDGDWTFEVRATDLAGNVGTAASYSFEVDTVAPVVQLTSTPAGRTNVTTPTFTYASSATDVAYFECGVTSQSAQQGLTTVAPSTCDADGFTSAPLADGRYRFSVTAVDLAGNRSGRASYDFLVDTVAPETTITSAPAKVVDTGTVTFAYSADKTGSTFECQLTTNGQAGAWESCAGASKTYTGLADGTYGFAVRATDRAGNVDATPATAGFAVNAGRPTISASLSSEHPVSAWGWYRGPVTITYTCNGNGSALAAPCPAPRVVPRAQKGRVFKATVTTVDGDTATVSTPMYIDKGNPKVAVKGFEGSKVYTSVPKNVRCVASDPRSGLDDCTLTVKKVSKKGERYVVVVAKATDKAGNVKVLRKQARLAS